MLLVISCLKAQPSLCVHREGQTMLRFWSTRCSTVTKRGPPIAITPSGRKRPFSSSSSSQSSAPTPRKRSPSLWERYSRLLEEYPTATKVVTSGVIMGSGDAACQCITTKDTWSEYDLHRTSKFVILGAVVVAPALHAWYGWLARLFPAQTTASALQRLAMDQLVFAPTFLPAFFTALQFMDGDFDLDRIKRKLEADYYDTLVANWILWVPANLLNFRFVPVRFQVLYSNGIGFVWNIFMLWGRMPDCDER